MWMMRCTLFGLLVGITAATFAATPIDPLPRATKSTTLQQWMFDRTNEGWVPENECSAQVKAGMLVVQSTGTDPFMHNPVSLLGGRIAVTLRLRSKVGGAGSVFWTTDRSPGRSERKRADFAIPADGKWLESTARFDAPGQLTDLRIDPGTRPGTIEIDYIRVSREEQSPLTIPTVRRDGNVVRFEIQNHRDQAVACTADGQAISVPAGGTRVVTRPVDGSKPVEICALTLRCDGWPPLTRAVGVENASADVSWINLPLGSYVLQVAPDGSAARVLDKDQPIVFAGPLVSRKNRIPRMALVAKEPNLQFRGEDVALEIGSAGNEISLAIRSSEQCEGPIVRVKGGLEQGLFAGLEYLGKGEQSSSSLDIETPEHIRFAPDPLKVTMPLMAFVTDRVSVAMTWEDMSLQPIYATPNFFDGVADHRMALRGPNIKVAIRIAKEPLEESILWAVKKRGLPPLPRAPRTDEQQRAICLAALNGPLKTKDGWGHCAQPRWVRQPYADMASTIWRLTGEAPVLPRLVLGGAHVRNPAVYFVTGRAQQWLDIQRETAQRLIKSQKPDGSYRYNGKFRRGHFEDTASGVCAAPAAQLLEFAYVTGDQRALDAGLRTLEFAKRFRTPRGAQVWEVPLHTPDQLASAYLVRAYLRGYQLTGREDLLREARKWALSGIPFTYLWSRYPIMAYATPPVYGATHWIAPNWMGLPVQWVGGVYAYSLALLAPHDNTLDWAHLARGILVSAQQQQYPDGPHIGLLPDSFNIPHQRRQPADINPCALVSLQLVLDGQLDSLSVAGEERHRVVAPFPVSIDGDQVIVKGRPGVAYQVLIDGHKIVDVKSKGRDVIGLE